MNLHQREAKAKTTGRKDVKSEDTRRSSVFTLSILSVSASSIVFISDTAGNNSMILDDSLLSACATNVALLEKEEEEGTVVD